MNTHDQNSQVEQNNVQVMIIIPKALKQYLATYAIEAKSSLRDEIINRLNTSFEHKEANKAMQIIVTDAVNAALSGKKLNKEDESK